MASSGTEIERYRALCLRFYMEGEPGARAAINYMETCAKPAGVAGFGGGAKK